MGCVDGWLAKRCKSGITGARNCGAGIPGMGAVAELALMTLLTDGDASRDFNCGYS